MQFLGIKWDNDTKKPFIKYKQSPNEGEERYYPLVFSDQLSITVLGSRHCIGSFEAPHYKIRNCQRNFDLLDDNQAQCPDCRRNDSTHFLPLDFLSYDQKDELKNVKYFNYINLFGEDIVKVGVAADSRKITRLLEQGAFASIIFASGDGYMVRRIEDILSRTLKIRQAVNWNTKMKLINKHITSITAKQILAKHFDDIHVILSTHFQQIDLVNEFNYFLEDYNLPLNNDIDEVLYIETVSPEDNISGSIIGVYGAIILIKKAKGAVVALNTKSLLGYSIEVTNRFSNTPESLLKYRIIDLNDKDGLEGGLF